MSGPLQQWPISMNKQIAGPCATSDNAWHNEHHQKAAHAPAEDHESKGSQRHKTRMYRPASIADEFLGVFCNIRLLDTSMRAGMSEVDDGHVDS